MKNAVARPTELKRNSSQGQAAAVRPLVLLVLALLLGVAVGLVWFRKTPGSGSTTDLATSGAGVATGLSDATRAVLQRLTMPVEIRFYSLLNESEAAAPRQVYAGRIADLLAEYERAAAGKIVVKLFDSTADSASAAAADGLEPLRLGRGLNYFGVAVSCQGQKAVMSSLAPEWEAALEFDLSRAIARVAGGAGLPGEVVVNPGPADAVSTEELLRAVPEAESLPLAEATQMVKAAGLEEFKTATAEMQAQLATAHQRLAEAQKESPEAEQAARIKVQQLQSEQNEKLAEIARRMQGRLAALQQLKRSTP